MNVHRTPFEIRKIRNCREWRDRVRPNKLRIDPYCQLCDMLGKLIEAVEVDHIEPLETGGAPFEYDNLQSLCKRCHVLKSAEENRIRNHVKVQ